MKKIIFMLIAIAIMSCQKENRIDPIEGGICFASGINLKFVNESGQDLLNPTLENSFDFNQMKLYYQRGDEKVEVYDTLYDWPRNLNLYENAGSYFLRVGTNYFRDNVLSENDERIIGKSITLLEMNLDITDTIETEWVNDKNEGSFFLMKAWYNGEYLDFHSDGCHSYCTIVK